MPNISERSRQASPLSVFGCWLVQHLVNEQHLPRSYHIVKIKITRRRILMLLAMDYVVEVRVKK